MFNFHYKENLNLFFRVCLNIKMMIMCTRIFSLITTIIFVFVVVPNIWIYKKLEIIKDIVCRVIISLTLFAIFTPAFIYLLIWLILYRLIIKCILWIYHGSKFSHMLDGRDRMYTVQVTSPHVILFLIKYNQPFEFYAKMSHTIGNTLKEQFQNDKIFSTISSGFGYNYLLKNGIPYSDYVKPLPPISTDLDKNSLLNAIEEHTQGPLPSNDKGLWDVFIGTQEIVWKNNPDDVEESYYPIVLRFHPCVSNILQIMNKILPVPYNEANEENKTGKESSYCKRKCRNCCVCLLSVKKCVQKSGFFFMTPSLFLVNTLAMNQEDSVKNPLYGSTLSHRKTFCVLDESTPDNIDLIKSIKKKFPGTTFQDVLLTAFTASLEEYYDRVLGGSPSSKPRFILSENYVSTKPIENIKKDCIDRSSTIMLKLPIGLRCEVGEIPIECMLKAISKERKQLKDSIENKIHHEVLKLCFTYLPSPLLKLFLSKYKFTTIVNNLPSPAEVRAIDGHTISNVYVWSPHRGSTGVSLTIATYDGRLQLTLSVDKALISNRDDVQNILDGIFNNLVKMNNIRSEQKVTIV